MSDIAIQVFAISGAVFWSTQLIPQIWLNYSRHSTEGLSGAMMMLWSIAGLPLGIHNILSNQHIALQVQAQILTGLSLATWAQTRYYGHRWSARRSIVWLLSLAVAFGTIEAAVVVGVKYGNVRPAITANIILATAILSAILLGLGVLRHYWDIYEHRSVRGISWGFVVLDAMGDLTSLIAIVLAKPIDPAATAIYGVELALWIGIMLAGVVFNLVPILKGTAAGQQASPTQLDTITADHREALTDTSSDSSAIRSAFAIVHGTLLQRNVHPRRSTRTEPSV